MGSTWEDKKSHSVKDGQSVPDPGRGSSSSINYDRNRTTPPACKCPSKPGDSRPGRRGGYLAPHRPGRAQFRHQMWCTTFDACDILRGRCPIGDAAHVPEDVEAFPKRFMVSYSEPTDSAVARLPFWVHLLWRMGVIGTSRPTALGLLSILPPRVQWRSPVQNDSDIDARPFGGEVCNCAPPHLDRALA